MGKITERQMSWLRRTAIRFGEDLMPDDCMEIIRKKLARGKCRKLGLQGCAEIIKEMMECSGFVCDDEEAADAAVYLV